VTFLTAGGGGYGKPEERDREAIKRDIKLGYVSKAKAEQLYSAAG
jgi:N-methylhydantoinase B